MKSFWNRIFYTSITTPYTKKIQSYYERESRLRDLVNCIFMKIYHEYFLIFV